MQRQEIKSYKRNIKLVALALTVILLVGVVAMCCVGCGVEKPDETNPGFDTPACGGAVVNVPEQQGYIQLVAHPLVEQDGLPVAEYNSWLIKVTKVEPLAAEDCAFDWNIKWENAESAWATGKPVTDYCTITPESDGAKQATLRNIKDFGERILIVVTSRDKPELQQTVEIDYVQKITGFTFNMPALDDMEMDIEYQFETSEYTVRSELSIELYDIMNAPTGSVYLRFNSALWNAYQNKINELAGFNSYTTTLVDQGRPKLSIEDDKIILTPTSDATFIGIYDIPLVDALLLVNSTRMDEYLTDKGMPLRVLREFLNSDDYDYHVTFGVRYKAVYNDVTYSSGEKVIQAKIDGNVLHVPVEGFELNTDHIYA